MGQGTCGDAGVRSGVPAFVVGAAATLVLVLLVLPPTPVCIGTESCRATEPPTAGATLITSIPVPRNSSRGKSFAAPRTGNYEFRYVSGAYSTYPANGAPAGQASWLASVAIFKGSPIWDGDILRTSDAQLIIGWGGQYFTTKKAAAEAASGQAFDWQLNEGDALTLITVDKQSRYTDNSGDDVRIEIWYLP